MAITIVPDWADALLREQNRILTALVWLGAIACGLLVFWMLGQLIYWSTSTSDRATTMGWSQAPLQTAYRESWWIAPRAQEERIEQWRSMRPAAWTRWQRIDRWRAGNLPARTIPVALVMGAVIVGLQAVGMTAVRPGTFALSSSLSLAGLLILALTTQQVGMIWRTRLAVLPLELTRPVARGALVREWMTAFLMDLLPGVTIAAATGAVGLMLAQANSGRATGWGWALSGYFVYLFPLAAVMAAGLGGVVVLVERAWLAITLCWGFVYVALMALMVASIAWSTATHGSTLRGMPSIPVELLWAPPLCAAVLAVFMVRRFAMMEVGRRA